MSYQLVKLQHLATDNIACPHCAQNVLDWQQEQYIQPCEHTLFVAMDVGFEYITDEFEQSMKHSVDEIHEHDDHYQIFTEISQASYANFLILQADLGMAGYSRYLGFTC